MARSCTCSLLLLTLKLSSTRWLSRSKSSSKLRLGAAGSLQKEESRCCFLPTGCRGEEGKLSDCVRLRALVRGLTACFGLEEVGLRLEEALDDI